MRTAYLACVLALLASPLSPCPAQFIRVPVFRPPVIHAPIHPPIIHHGGASAPNQAQPGQEILPWVIGGIASLAAVGVVVALICWWRKRAAARAIVRIKSIPPGEAPVQIRQAWVGLEFPVIAGKVSADMGPAQGVLTGQAVRTPPSYAVDGRTAIGILQSASPEAAAWWRQNVPQALARGHQLIFPAEACERLDDLGSAQQHSPPGNGDFDMRNLDQVFNEIFPQGRNGPFRTTRNDAVLTVPITAHEAFHGTTVEVQTAAGRPLSIKVPPGVQAGTRLRLRGVGGADQYLELTMAPPDGRESGEHQ